MKMHFLVIDESALDCFIAQKIIEQLNKDFQSKAFQDPLSAFAFVKEGMLSGNNIKAVILLDLHMPLMSGFEFVEEFEKLPTELIANYNIITISSSLNKIDIQRVLSYNAVANHLEKPITREKLSWALSDIWTDGIVLDK